jgi:hypothetical protein
MAFNAGRRCSASGAALHFIVVHQANNTNPLPKQPPTITVEGSTCLNLPGGTSRKTFRLGLKYQPKP